MARPPMAEHQFRGMVKRSSLVSGDILARDMETAGNVETLAKLIRPHLKDAETVGLPAILGMKQPQGIIEKLSHGGQGV